jgi:hypothetical protein
MTQWTSRTAKPDTLTPEEWSFIHQCLSTSPDRLFAQSYSEAVRKDEHALRTGSGRLLPSSWDPTPIPPATFTQLKGREGLLEKLLADGVIQPKRPIAKPEDLHERTFGNELKAVMQGPPETNDLTIDVTMAAEGYVTSQMQRGASSGRF